MSGSSRQRSAAIVLLLSLVAAACSTGGEGLASSSTVEPLSLSSTTSVSAVDTEREIVQTTTVAPRASTSSTSTSTSTTTTQPNTTTTTTTEPISAPSFSSRVDPIDEATSLRMQNSWREGCPVGLDQLRLITLTHWNYDGRVSTGELVIHQDWADEIVVVFAALFEAGFPIERMELVDEFEGDDNLSMAANNTSGFNCREVAFRPGVWSNHAFGTAIDINPLVNPYLSGDTVLPPEGRPFIDRTVEVQGGIYSGDAVTSAFASIGWGWGGDWVNSKDWQHFSASGN